MQRCDMPAMAKLWTPRSKLTYSDLLVTPYNNFMHGNLIAKVCGGRNQPAILPGHVNLRPTPLQTPSPSSRSFNPESSNPSSPIKVCLFFKVLG